jgi:hypothetical protein
MTSGVTLSISGVSVDFNSATVRNMRVTDRFSNPFLNFPTPIQVSQKIGENTVLVNIGFMRQSFDLSFVLLDGPGTFDFSSPGSTNYEKIKYMAGKKTDPKTLTLNGTTFTGQIESVNIPWEPGKKDLSTNGTIIFTVGMDLKMES